MVAALSAIERAGKPNCRRYFDDGRIFIGSEPNEDINFVAGKLGDDCLLVASDLPHLDEAMHDDVAEQFIERGDLSDDRLEKMFHRNAMRAFGLDVGPGRAAAPAESAAHAG